MQNIKRQVFDRLGLGHGGGGKDWIAPHPQHQHQLRQIHIEPGPREKALLEEDPALKKFKSHKKSIYRMQRFGDVLSIIVLTGCCYEIYYRTMKKKAEREQQQATSE